MKEKIEEIEKLDKNLDIHIDSINEIINYNSDKTDFYLLNEIGQELRLAEEVIEEINLRLKALLLFQLVMNMTDKLLKIWINFDEDINKFKQMNISGDNAYQTSHPIFGKLFKFHIFKTYSETVRYNSVFENLKEGIETTQIESTQFSKLFNFISYQTQNLQYFVSINETNSVLDEALSILQFKQLIRREINNKNDGSSTFQKTKNTDGFHIYLDLKSKEHIKFFKMSHKLKRQPTIFRLSLRNIKSIDKDIKLFLSTVEPKKLTNFEFRLMKPNDKNKEKIDFYYEELLKSLPIDGPSYKIESLCLYYSGNKYSNGQFYFDKESFEYIIAAISESTMKYSLKRIRLVYNELSTNKVRQTLNKYGLKHVEMM